VYGTGVEQISQLSNFIRLLKVGVMIPTYFGSGNRNACIVTQMPCYLPAVGLS